MNTRVLAAAIKAGGFRQLYATDGVDEFRFTWKAEGPVLVFTEDRKCRGNVLASKFVRELERNPDMETNIATVLTSPYDCDWGALVVSSCEDRVSQQFASSKA